MSDEAIDPQLVENLLADFPDPETGRGLKVMEQIADVKIDGQQVAVKIGLTTYSAPLWEQTQQTIE
ncbi:MAG: iron-sulfur cluster assembly protein, partial [Lacipirellulaceae bacterium]